MPNSDSGAFHAPYGDCCGWNSGAFDAFCATGMLLGLVLAFSLEAVSLAAPPPNIVILLADDLGYGELGCQGNPEIPTPHIDSLASGGVRCTQAYVTAPNCSPSRAGLLTGRVPTRFGYEFNPIGARNEEPGVGLPISEKILSEMLHDAGYTTGLVGKWHLGGTAPFHPLRRGFDEFFGFLHEGHFYAPVGSDRVTSMLRRRSRPDGGKGLWGTAPLFYSTHMNHDEPAYDANNPILRNGQPVVERDYLTDAITREAVDFIGRHKDKPFLLYVAYNAVHSPLQGDNRYLEIFSHIRNIQRRIFAAMLSHLDDSVGAITAKLSSERLDQKTLVFFLSDNGGPTRELTSSNKPLRGEKGSMYEGGLRVPFIAKWNGQLPAATVFDQPISTTDIVPTVCSACNVPISSERLDGVDLLPHLKGDNSAAPHGELFWRQGNRRALRSDHWKLVSSASSKWELYDLEKDVSEQNDLAQSQPQKLAELIQQWNVRNAQMAQPLFR